MPYPEVRVVEYWEVLRRWLARDGVRAIAKATCLDRKTVRRFVKIAAQLGLRPGDPWPPSSVVQDLPARHQAAQKKILLDHRTQIRGW